MRAIIFTLALIGFAPRAFAQAVPPDPNPAVYLKSKLLYFKFGLGQGGPVFQDGRAIDLGFFGENAKAFFSEIPAAIEPADNFRLGRTLGFSLSMVGLAAVAIDLGFLVNGLITSPISGTPLQSTSVLIGVEGGGIILALVGSFMDAGASAALFEAVNRYNAGMLNKYLPDGQKIDLRLYSSGDNRGAMVAWRF